MTELSLSESLRAPGASPRAAALLDFFHHWFSEVEAQGEDTMFRLGRFCLGDPEPSWICLPHHTFDGLGGLLQVLEQRGQHLELPLLRGPYPGALARVVAALRVLTAPRRRLLRFKRELGAQSDGARPIVAWALFERSETSELRALSRAGGTSLNAFLLHGLTVAIGPLLADGSGAVNWVVPVNMRGVAPELAPTANQAATLDIAFPRGASARAIDHALTQQRGRNLHFGVWQLLEWLGGAGPRVVRFLARRELRVRKHGSFSNMGNLRLTGESSERPNAPEWWMAVNPVQRSRPLGAACVSYCGRLALTLQLHPVLGLDRGAARDLMSAWVEAIHQPPRTDSRSTAGTMTLPPGSGGAKLT